MKPSMHARAFAVLLSATFLAEAAPSWADEAPEPSPPEVVLVDFASLPIANLPPLPAESSTPSSAPNERFTGLKVEAISDKPSVKPSVKRSKKRHHKKGAKAPQARVVMVTAADPSLGILYAPAANATEYDGDASQRMQCRNGDQITPLRWETLSLGPDGNARLELHDVWFDARSCSARSGSTSVAALKPIAWDHGRPWLFAARNDTTVTFVMPRSNEMAAETMVGSPITVRGAFTRVTLPLGRWGSGSVVASLSSMSLEPPTKSKPGSKASHPSDAGDSDQRSVEVSIELVQTMAETHPTLVVRTREPDAVASLQSFE
jgi:hypothetical protein